MLSHPGFSFATASLLQDFAILGFVIFFLGFFIWLVNLARQK